MEILTLLPGHQSEALHPSFAEEGDRSKALSLLQQVATLLTLACSFYFEG